jgi:hypothetical protein
VAQRTIDTSTTGDTIKQGFDKASANAQDAETRVGALEGAGPPDWSEVTGKPDTFPPAPHDHDSRYYTEAEVNDLLAARDALRDPVRTARVFDDFASGVGSSGNAGDLGWSFGAGSFVPWSGLPAGRIGVYRRNTGTTAGTYAAAFGWSNATAGMMRADLSFDFAWSVMVETNDTDTLARFGLMASNADPTADGIYFEKPLGETNWYGVCRSASVETRTAVLAPSTTSYAKLRCRRLDATSVAFSVDGGAETVVASNVPSSANVQPYLAVKNNAAADKAVRVDYFYMVISGLMR